jgi:hypothetical protein
MSAYGLTPAMLQQRLGGVNVAKGLCTEQGAAPPDQTAIDAVCVEKIAAAEADIHVAAGVYYVIPITPREDAPAQDAAALTKFIQGKGLDLAAYKMMELKPAILNAGEKALYWSQLKKSLDAWLLRLQESDETRRTTLPAALGREEAVTSTGGAWSEADENQFSPDRMRGWI